MIKNSELSFKELCIKNFENFEKTLNGERDLSVHSLRKKSFQNLNSINIPSTKDEEWKYTNISFLNNKNYLFPIDNVKITSDTLRNFLFHNFEHSLMTFVNGFFYSETSDLLDISSGVQILSLNEAIKKRNFILEKYLGQLADDKNNFFTSLNSSFIKDGIFIYIPDGKIIEEPIHIIFYQSSFNQKNLIQPRNLIVIGKNSQASIIEHYLSDTNSDYFTNSVTEIFVDENSHLDHIKLQEESLNSIHIGRMDILQERNSSFTSHLISIGSKFSRNEFNSRFNGEGSQSTLNGLFMIEDEQLFDAHTLIDHAKPNCNSYEHYKGILQDSSRGVFNGKVLVRKDAQKTNAFQENNTILLSESAIMNSKPQLEIFADDVKCSHGATVGKLNEEAKFYLKTRGIGEEAATAMLIHAFASDVITSIKIESLREYLEKIISRKFN